jgi:predicted amidophosphoribosyltransferase
MTVMATGHIWLLLLMLLVLAAIVVAVVAVVRLGASLQTNRRECPACKEKMRRDASICPHCRTPSQPWAPT